MHLAICGPGRAGKDTASEWFAQNTTLRYCRSTSQAAKLICFNALRLRYGYKTAEEAFEDRHNHRKEWAQLMWEHNQPDGVTLYRGMLRDNDILNGIRRKQELDACRAFGLVDLVLWIDRDVAVDPSLDFEQDEADIVIPNNRSLRELFCRLARFAHCAGILRESNGPRPWMDL